MYCSHSSVFFGVIICNKQSFKQNTHLLFFFKLEYIINWQMSEGLEKSKSIFLSIESPAIFFL